MATTSRCIGLKLGSQLPRLCSRIGPRPINASHVLHQFAPSSWQPISLMSSCLARTISTKTAEDKMINASSAPQASVDSYLTTNVFDLLSLKDRVVVITGGAKGIGMALAFAVAEAGGKVAILDASPEPSEVYAKLQSMSKQVGYYQSDVTNYGVLKESFQSVAKDFGRIDGVITAAGTCPDQPFLERDPQSVKRCLEINTLGTYYSAQLAAIQMDQQPKLENSADAGSIVLIASIAAHQASKDQFTSDYCMSKGGVLSLTRQLGVELAQKHIRVNCISPGYIMTDMTLDLVKQRPKLGEVFKDEPPMKRMGDRTDLKAAAVYLLSNASAYMTSAEMHITGGMHAGKVY